MRRLLAILILLAAPAFAATYNLNSSSNWQSIVQSTTGTNTFNLAAGTYTCTGGPLVVAANSTIVGAGPESTYLVAAASTNVVNARATNIVLAGMTITGGNSMIPEGAGGVYGHGLTVITNCNVIGNTNSGSIISGGGAYGCSIYNSKIAHNVCTTNFNSTQSGTAAAYLSVASAVVDSCLIESNTSSFGCGGVGAGWNYTYGTMLNSTSRWNTGYQSGGAGLILVVSNSVLEFNTAKDGAAVYGCPFIVDSVIRSNWGYTIRNSSARNLLIEYNGYSGGSVIYNCYITNCVVRYNNGVTQNGGLSKNCSFYGNTNTGDGVLWGYVVATSCLFSNNLYHAAGLSTLDSCVIYGANSVANGTVGAWRSTLRNNTFISPSTNAVIVQGTGEKSYVVANNLIISPNTNTIKDSTGAAWTNVSCNYITNEVTWAEGTNDYTPTDAAIINQADPTYVNGTLDYYGNPRYVPEGLADIGAVENQDPPVAATSARRRWIWNLILGD